MRSRARLVSLGGLVLAMACAGPEDGGAGPTQGSGESTASEATTAVATAALDDGSSTIATPEASTTGASDGDTTGTSTTGDATTSGSSTGIPTDDTTTGELDEDRDGHPTSTDCDDTDPEIHPGAVERCNGLDDDCDPGTSEDGVASVDGQGSFVSLLAAVTAAVPGSEVRVCPGVWQENVGIPHALTLVSQEGAAVTTIDGGGMGPTLAVSAGEVTITGFTLTNGTSFGFGGGLSVTGTEPVTVEDCVITGNTSSDGAGIYASAGAELSVTGTTIAGNTGGIGGGVAMLGDGLSGRLTMSGCTIAQNVSNEFGAGLVIVGMPSVEITSTAIIDNDSVDGGGLGIVDSSVVITSSTVLRNSTAGQGGGFLLYPDPSELVSVDSDWGTGADDNVPQDVSIPGVGDWSSYGAGASFTCDMTGCQ